MVICRMNISASSIPSCFTCLFHSSVFYFFFQAEDGIRDYKVTGVQTCALPSELHLHRALQAPLWDEIEAERADCLFVYLTHDLDFAASRRSEERRVGKECKTRGVQRL